jgi:predicted RNA binding protein YcfA (HicA-like mRNA interferase family)
MSDGSLPSLSPEKVVRILKKCGFVELRQKGNHLILFNELTGKRVVVPMHKGKDIKKPLLRKVIELEAQLTIDEFLKFL